MLVIQVLQQTQLLSSTLASSSAGFFSKLSKFFYDKRDTTQKYFAEWWKFGKDYMPLKIYFQGLFDCGIYEWDKVTKLKESILKNLV